MPTMGVTRGLAGCLMLLLALVAPGDVAAEELRAGARGRPLEPLLLPDELYTESYVISAELEGGVFVSGQLGISNAGAGDQNGACRVTVVERGEKPWTASVIVERAGWAWAGGEAPSLTVGSCRMVAGERFTFHASLDGRELSIGLDLDARKERTAVHGATSSGGGFYDLELLVPVARGAATLTRAGRPPQQLAGYGYADHSRATALPGQTAKRWVRFTGLDGSAPAAGKAAGELRSKLVLVRIPPKGPEHDGWLWAPGAGPRVPLTRVAITQGPGSGAETGWRVMLDGEGGPWKLTTGELLRRDAPLEERGVLGSVLGAVVGNPVTYTYRGVLATRRDRSELHGILEITLSSE